MTTGGLGLTAREAARKAFTLENFFKVVNAAEKVAASPLFDKLTHLIPELGITLTDAERASLRLNYESYLKAIAESEKSAATGRASSPEEGDTD